MFLYFPPYMVWLGPGQGMWVEYNGWEMHYVDLTGHYTHAESVINEPTHWLPALPVPE